MMKRSPCWVLMTACLTVAACKSEQKPDENETKARVTAEVADAPAAKLDVETQPRAAALLMDAYEARTGVTSDEEPGRYLWTDAFAVCNELGLATSLDEPGRIESARKIIEAVHQTLARHREDDAREGWLSGLEEEKAREHPTAGGLRIGKKLGERAADEPIDQRLEWDRDGQYFHYLTKWMHALDLTTRLTEEPRYNQWARELAETAHEAFVYETEAGAKRMYWKMSIDLTRPLVSSMGAQDPLDGWVTYRQLNVTAETVASPKPRLEDEIEDFETMLRESYVTSDPLGLGGVLMQAVRLAQLDPDDPRVEDLLRSALRGIRSWAASQPLDRDPSNRLAFRELGLAIGLAGLAIVEAEAGTEARKIIGELATFLPLRRRIIEFWTAPDHQSVSTWTGHRDINEVMLATALAPSGCLELPAPKPFQRSRSSARDE